MGRSYGKEEKRLKEKIDHDNAARAGSRADRDRRVSPRGSIEADQFPLNREGVRMFPANVKIDGAQHLKDSIPGDAIAGLPISKTGGELGWDRVNSPDHLRTYEKLRNKLVDDGFRRST